MARPPERLARRPRAGSRRGSALLATLLVMVVFAGLLYAASTLSHVEVKESRRAIDDVRAQYLAEAGVERGLAFLRQAVANQSAFDPLGGLTALFAGGPTISPLLSQPVLNQGAQVGSFSISMTAVEQTADSVTVAIDATGYVPASPAELPAGRQLKAWRAMRTTVRYALAPSQVFDYAYFINNWGWLYGNTIRVNGNARSNGQFDAAGYRPTVTGQPLYDQVSWDGANAVLSGYRDDNGDGLLDGNDGGVFAGWDIVGAHRVRGNGGVASNQHDYQPQVEMPNLNDLTRYEARAAQLGSSITIGGAALSGPVYGDEPSERQNLYLNGTWDNPIVLDGPVVVRGDVIITGYVTGKGAIYAGGNVYCPDSVRYKNPPSAPRPADNTQAATEAWLSSNWDKDFLGLFARENVVVGDHTNSTWRHYVSSWMGNSMNSSGEDAGVDLIPHTGPGRDGIVGTADDDVLEGDGSFTVDHYTEHDAELGTIPPGKNVGDPIPGTGEDIDGDGVYDGTLGLADLDFSSPLTPGHWGGMQTPIVRYRDIASLSASQLDAVLYTNHSFNWVVTGGQAARIRGALVCRNENVVYGTPELVVDYDARLLGGNTGAAAGLLPTTMLPPQVLRWMDLETDPNRYLVP